MRAAVLAAIPLLAACATGVPVERQVVVPGDRFVAVQGEAGLFVRTFLPPEGRDRREVVGADCRIVSSIYTTEVVTPSRLVVPNFGPQSPELVATCRAGDLTGTAFLTGTPYYNSDTRQLSFPDLEYTLDTSQTLLSVANWFAQSQIRDRLREKFTVDMTQSIERMKQGLESVLNRRRGNVQLHGSVEQLDLVGVYRLPNGDVFTAFLTASGKISADVDVQ